MFRRAPAIAFFALFCIAGAASVQANQAAETGWKHALTDLPPPAPGVEVLYWFPDHGRLQFPVGTQVRLLNRGLQGPLRLHSIAQQVDRIDVVLGFHNGGDETLNVTNVMGSINSPASFNIYVQNFTAASYGVVVPPGDEASLQYSFTPNKQLHPREFSVALTAFYSSAAGERFSTTFFNKTADLVEKPAWVDFELLGLYLGFAAGLAGLAYLLYKWLSGFSWVRSQLKKRGPSRAPAKDPAPMAGAQNEWLQGTFAPGAKKVKSRSELKKAS